MVGVNGKGGKESRYFLQKVSNLGRGKIGRGAIDHFRFFNCRFHHEKHYCLFGIFLALIFNCFLFSGTFARVCLCRERTSRDYFALKILAIHDVIRLKQVEHVKNEKNILKVN